MNDKFKLGYLNSWRETSPYYNAVVLTHGGVPTDTSNDFIVSPGCMQLYFSKAGVKHFKAIEFVEPHRREIAEKLGYKYLIPESEYWIRAIALAKLLDNLRDKIGPIRVRNWWRPEDYNKAVGGAPGSDHIDACAVDVDFADDVAGSRSREWLMQKYDKEKWMQMSLGFYKNKSNGKMQNTAHVGLFSPEGRRCWTQEK